MADLFKALKPEKHNAKSGFDLSQKHVFSQKCGQLQPVLALETVPDDYLEIDLMSITRTLTLNTAAFLRGKMRFDFFFVPNSQLWHMFNQFITQRTDKHSTLSKGAKFCPNVQLSDILTMILNDSTSQDIHGLHWRDNAVRILDMLGYGNFQMLLDEDIEQEKKTAFIAQYEGKYVNIFRLAAYQHIWYDFYRNKFYDTGDSGDASSYDVGDYVSYFNFDDIDCTSVANSHIPCSSTAEKARVRGLLGMRYVQWQKDLFTSSLPGQQFGVVSSVDLGFNLSDVTITGNGAQIGKAVGRTFNNDYYSIEGGNILGENLKAYTDGGGTDRVVIGATTATQARGFLNHAHTYADGVVNSLEGEISGLSLSGAQSASFDVLSLYKAQMLQNWKQATLRAGNMTDDNFLAHYGVTPRYEGDENVDFLGSFESSLKINDVSATASSNAEVNGKVGDLGAYGVSVTQGNKIKYKARDFGIVMCVASFLPQSEYSSTMLDKANTLLEEFDYYTPEFENIGLEAIPLSQFDNNVPAELMNKTLGFAPRYWMYKTALDKVHGEFSNAGFSMYSTQALVKTDLLGSLSPWVAPRTESIFAGTLSGDFSRKLRSFYVSPDVLDNIFGVAVDSSQKSDQFLNNVFFDIKAIRPMSVLGLPQF